MYINLLAQLKNAQLAKKESLKLPYSKMDEAVAKILADNKYIDKAEKKGRGSARVLDLKLKYSDNKGAISGIRLFSKPSRKYYLNYKDIKPVKSGYGTMVVSTSKGIMTGSSAKKNKIGGEILFTIW